MSDASDAQIIAASVDAPSAFAEIYDRHAETTLRFLVRRVGLDVAEGLMGETFRIAFERRAAFEQSSPNARPWLYGIASNLLLNHRRSEARRLRATARLAAEPAQGRSNETTADTHRLLERIVDAIDTLPDGERDALLLFAWEELDYEEVAAALAIPVGTVRSRLNRARKRLRQLVEMPGSTT